MKKISLLLAALMITGASFACDGNKNCKGNKAACCKKEVAEKGKDAKACCKKNVAGQEKEAPQKESEKKTAQK